MSTDVRQHRLRVKCSIKKNPYGTRRKFELSQTSKTFFLKFTADIFTTSHGLRVFAAFSLKFLYSAPLH